LTIYDGDPKFFCLGRIKQHALHSCTPALRLTGTATFGGLAQAPDGYYSDESVIMAGLEQSSGLPLSVQTLERPGRKLWLAVLSANQLAIASCSRVSEVNPS
jgi:hypothetical protein